MTSNDIDDLTAVKNVGKTLLGTGAAAVLAGTIAMGVASADEHKSEQPELDPVEYVVPAEGLDL